MQIVSPIGMLYTEPSSWNCLQVWSEFCDFYRKRIATASPKADVPCTTNDRPSPAAVMCQQYHPSDAKPIENALLAIDWCLRGGAVHHDVERALQYVTPSDVYLACKLVVTRVPNANTSRTSAEWFFEKLMHDCQYDFGKFDTHTPAPLRDYLKMAAENPEEFERVVPQPDGYAFVVEPQPHERFKVQHDITMGVTFGDHKSITTAIVYTGERRVVRRILQEQNPAFEKVLRLVGALN